MYIIDKNFNENKENVFGYSRKMILELPSSKMNEIMFKDMMSYSLVNENANPTININDHISNYQELYTLFALFRSSEYNGDIIIPDNGKIEILHSLFQKAILKKIYIDITLLRRVQNINYMFQDCVISGNVIGVLPDGSFFKPKEKKALFPIKKMDGAFSRVYLNKFIFILKNIEPYDDFDAEYTFSGAAYTNYKSENTLDLSFMHGGKITDLFRNFHFDIIGDEHSDPLIIDLSNFDLKTYLQKHGYCEVNNAFAVSLDYRQEQGSTIIFKLHKNWLLYPDLLQRAIGVGAGSNNVSIIEHNDHILLKMKAIGYSW